MRKNNVVDLTDRRRETREQVLERLFHEHGAALRAFLRVRMVAAGDGEYEDLEQDVFMRLAKMDQLESRLPVGMESNRSFIIKVANNLILDLERQKRVRKAYLESHGEQLQEADINTVSPDMEVQADRELEQVKQVLMAMKPRWRDAFILHRFGNKCYAEIASEMGVSAKQIEKYIRQAVGRLKAASQQIRGVK